MKLFWTILWTSVSGVSRRYPCGESTEDTTERTEVEEEKEAMKKHRHCSPVGEDENFNSQLANSVLIHTYSICNAKYVYSVGYKTNMWQQRLPNVGVVPGTLELMLHQESFHTQTMFS